MSLPCGQFKAKATSTWEYACDVAIDSALALLSHRVTDLVVRWFEG